MSAAKNPDDGLPDEFYFRATDGAAYEEWQNPEQWGCVRFSLPGPGDYRFYARSSMDACRWEGEIAAFVGPEEVVDLVIPVAYTC